MVEKFIEYMAVEKRYSQHTLISYEKDLKDFQGFLMKTEGQDNLLKVEKKMVRNFMMELSEQGIAKRSINRKLSTLRSFYRYLLKIGEIAVSPMEGVQTLKFNAEKQIPFSEEEMWQLQKASLYKGEDYFLEKLVIETLYQTGMRKSELCGLLMENVDFSKNELRVKGKGNKVRMIPISKELTSELMSYLAYREPLEGFEGYFFISKRGKKLNPRWIYEVVHRYFSMVTAKEKKSPHILRHSFATHILNRGAEISKVKAILGHASLSSTQVYTDANIEQLKKIFNQAHPRAGKNEREKEEDGNGSENK